jgi:hypothetical protein
MSKVTITWKAFGNKPERNRYITSVTFETDFKVSDVNDQIKLLDVIYHVTNTYSGNLWNIIEPLLSPNRTHTAISVGDEIQIDDNLFRCDDAGWSQITSLIYPVTK